MALLVSNSRNAAITDVVADGRSRSVDGWWLPLLLLLLLVLVLVLLLLVSMVKHPLRRSNTASMDDVGVGGTII